MDVLSVLGLLLGAAALFGGNLLEGGHVSALINGSAFIIVFGGTLGAAMLQTPLPVFKRAFAIVSWVLKPPLVDLTKVRKQLVNWGQRSRKDGLLGLEGIAETEQRHFYKQGLMLLVDGTEPDTIRDVLQTDLMLQERADLEAAKVFDAMGGYAPTIGIIGAVLGLIHVMGNLGDPSQLGAGIATAFVATIYGVAAANLIFIPIGQKLRATVRELALEKELVIDGLVAIAEGENPRIIEMRLTTYQQAS